jgi:tetratricopeptide (TPR) repeat protein
VCLQNQGKNAEAIACWRDALQLEPNNVNTVDQTAWMLATCPDAAIRDGKEALELAQRAVQLSKGDVPMPLGTLAAAYAEVGRFSDAVETAQRAIDRAVELKDSELVGAFRAQIKSYRANRPYRESPRERR